VTFVVIGPPRQAVVYREISLIPQWFRQLTDRGYEWQRSINKPLGSETLQTLVSQLDSECTGISKVRDCCLKYLLSDRRIHLINLGMRWEHEVATNSQLVDAFEPPYLPLALSS
jgi:hypothetical protein